MRLDTTLQGPAKTRNERLFDNRGILGKEVLFSLKAAVVLLALLLASAVSAQTFDGLDNAFNNRDNTSSWYGSAIGYQLDDFTDESFRAVEDELNVSVDQDDLNSPLPDNLRSASASVRGNSSTSMPDLDFLEWQHRGEVSWVPSSESMQAAFSTSRQNTLFETNKPTLASLNISLGYDFGDPVTNQTNGGLFGDTSFALGKVGEDLPMLEFNGGFLYDSAGPGDGFFPLGDLDLDLFAAGLAAVTLFGAGEGELQLGIALDILLEEDTQYFIDTTVSASLFTDGSDGNNEAIRVDSSNTVIFNLSSSDPDARFTVGGFASVPESPTALLLLGSLLVLVLSRAGGNTRAG